MSLQVKENVLTVEKWEKRFHQGSRTGVTAQPRVAVGEDYEKNHGQDVLSRGTGEKLASAKWRWRYSEKKEERKSTLKRFISKFKDWVRETNEIWHPGRERRENTIELRKNG